MFSQTLSCSLTYFPFEFQVRQFLRLITTKIQWKTIHISKKIRQIDGVQDKYEVSLRCFMKFLFIK